MAVDNPGIKIDQYKSDIPLVQLPTEAPPPAQPLRGQFGAKGTGPLAIGDAIFKGFLQGHAVKEQRKMQQAQAKVAAEDAGSEALYQRYQDTRSQYGGKEDDPNVKAAYDAYAAQVNKAKALKISLLPPDKNQKKESGKDKGAINKAYSNIKEWMAANPHVIPSISIAAMQPKPPGQSREAKQQDQQSALTTLETQRQQQIVDQGVRLQNAQKAYDSGYATFGNLGPTEIAALPPDAKKQYEAWDQARSVVTQSSAGGGVKLYTRPDGTQEYYRPGSEPTGSVPATSAASQPKGEEAMVADYYRKNGIDPKNADPELRKYLHDWWQFKAPQTATTANTSTVDEHGNRVSTTSTARGTSEPKPPAGYAPVEPLAQGGMTAPPSGSKRASGGMTAPPGRSGMTLTDANRTEKVESEKTTRYQKAQDKFDKRVDANKKNPKLDAKAIEQLNQDAYNELMKEHQEIEKWYNGQVHAIGGTVKGDNFSVTVGDKTFKFPNQQAMENFKRDAGIQ